MAHQVLSEFLRFTSLSMAPSFLLGLNAQGPPSRANLDPRKPSRTVWRDGRPPSANPPATPRAKAPTAAEVLPSLRAHRHRLGPPVVQVSPG
jgi:hypothetical protein